MKKQLLILVVLLGMLFSVRSAYATTTIYADQVAAQAAGQDGLSDFTAFLTWTQSNPTSGTLSIDLDNTSSPTVDGIITGFLFNQPQNLSSLTANFTGAAAAFEIDSPLPNNGAPFGTFDFDIGFASGYNVNDGIEIEDGIVTFDFNAVTAGLVTEQDFINASSDNNDKEGEFFLVRFQSTEVDSGSDKVPGKSDGLPPVPEPATLLLLGPALLSLLGLRKKA